MEARLQVALDFEREFDANVACLQPVGPDFALPGDLCGRMIAELIPAIQESAGAVPLLRTALSVTLANVTGHINDPGAFLPSVDGAEYLSRHGIGCDIVEIDPGEQIVGQTLANAAAARNAAFLVFGAHSRRRAVEGVSGGVTCELFCNAPLPVLAAHWDQ